MKIVIDIPEIVYEAFKEWHKNKVATVEQSTPLPKGHGDLIDREELLSGIEKEYTNKLSPSEAKAFVEFMAYIDDEPKPVIEADKGEE